MSDTQTPPAQDPQVSPPNPVPQVPTSTNPAAPIQPAVGRRQKEIAPFPVAVPTETSSQTTETVTPPSNEYIGSGPAEVEPTKELEPEIDKAIERVKEQKIKVPTETVISADQAPASVPQTVAKPIVVLPLSEEEMQQGKNKSPKNSIRWLYVWCVRQIRKLREFMVVYREE